MEILFFILQHLIIAKKWSNFFFHHGANINEKCVGGGTILQSAALSNSIETVEFLLSLGVNIDEKNHFGDTALISIAVHENTEKTVEFLISHGANVNEKM